VPGHVIEAVPAERALQIEIFGRLDEVCAPDVVIGSTSGEGERLQAIREEKDASPEELEVNLCNGGIMGLRAEPCLRLLDEIGDDYSQGEYYLTDVVEIAAAEGLLATVIDVDELEISGINTIEQLQILEEIYLSEKENG